MQTPAIASERPAQRKCLNLPERGHPILVGHASIIAHPDPATSPRMRRRSQSRHAHPALRHAIAGFEDAGRRTYGDSNESFGRDAQARVWLRIHPTWRTCADTITPPVTS